MRHIAARACAGRGRDGGAPVRARRLHGGRGRGRRARGAAAALIAGTSRLRRGPEADGRLRGHAIRAVLRCLRGRVGRRRRLLPRVASILRACAPRVRAAPRATGACLRAALSRVVTPANLVSPALSALLPRHCMLGVWEGRWWARAGRGRVCRNPSLERASGLLADRLPDASTRRTASGRVGGRSARVPMGGAHLAPSVSGPGGALSVAALRAAGGRGGRGGRSIRGALGLRGERG